MSLPVELDWRDDSPLGVVRRQRFEESVEFLRDTGLPSQLIEHYRRLARATRQLPHELVRRDVEQAIKRAG